MDLNYNWSLKKAIMNNNYNQAEFSEKIGRDPAFISRILRGRINPTDAEKEIIAKALDMKVSELFE